MRVITGVAKGKKLKTVKGYDTRPTPDRIKESIFNIISTKIIDCHFLDLYSGSGGIGIEALSRGAASAVFIDKNPQTTRLMKENLKNTGLSGEVYTNEVLRGLKVLKKRNRQFDIIFLDPPYNKGLIEKTVEKISEYSLLSSEGLLIIEYSSKEDIPDEMWKFIQVRKESYGYTIIGFFCYEEGLCEN